MGYHRFAVQAILLAPLLACSPSAGSTGSTGSTGGGSGTSGEPVTGTTGTTHPTDASTTAATNPTEPIPTTTTDADSTSADSTGVTFIVPRDGGACPLECDPFIRDSCCDPQQKCTAFADGGGGSWNALKCVPVDRNPDQPGEPCTVEDSATSGLDSCAKGAMCWNVDDMTLVGVCVALCTGTQDQPVCGPGTSCAVTNDGVLALCLPDCDPLSQDCPSDQVCVAGDKPMTPFVCAPDLSDAGHLFDPCEFLNACEAGLACVDSENSAMCDPRVDGCCLPFCDLSAPICPADTTCAPWYPMDMAPMGLEKVGLCRL